MSDSNGSGHTHGQDESVSTTGVVSSNYKVLGYNQTGTGTTYGVLGQVDSADGFGLFTPDDAKIKGTVDTDATDFTVEAGTTSTGDARNVVLGHAANHVQDGAVGATISGGGYGDATNDFTNFVTDDYCTVGGGFNNRAGSAGDDDSTSDTQATVCGGGQNAATGFAATCGGGNQNVAGESFSTVSGGSGNEATGKTATVPGGQQCEASGNDSFAAGTAAKARDWGAFVWADWSSNGSNILQPFSSDAGLGPTGSHTFSVRATGGARIGTSVDSNGDVDAGVKVSSGSGSWSSLSARSAKSNVDPVDPESVLEGVESLTVSTWEYDTQPEVAHMGPMAGEFREAFGLGPDADSISAVDADGVALAAIQGLSHRLDEVREEKRAKDERIEDLEAENEELRDRLGAVEDRLAALETERDSPEAAAD